VKYQAFSWITMVDTPRYSMSVVAVVMECKYWVTVGQFSTSPEPTIIRFLNLVPKVLQLKLRQFWDSTVVFSGHALAL
jgi:hypothetical protein